MLKTIKNLIQSVPATLLSGALSVALFVAPSVAPFVALLSTSIPASAGSLIYPYDTSRVSTLRDRPDWMRDLPDETLLSDMSIPGTWNSNVIGELGPKFDRNIAQVATIEKQLRSGIRALSMNVALVSRPGTSWRVPVIWVTQPFEPSLPSIKSFLTAHPSETVVLRLNGGPGSNSIELARTLTRMWTDPAWDKYLWKPGKRNPAIPKLSEVRGKIVLIQGPSIAYMNLSFAEEPGNPLLDTQIDKSPDGNEYLYPKWEKVKEHMVKAAANWQRGIIFSNALHGDGAATRWYVATANHPILESPFISTGYPSIYGDGRWEDFERGGCLGDRWICTVDYTGVNLLTMQFIETANPVHVGILWADIPGRGLIDAIIRINQPARPQVQVRLGATDQCLDVVGGTTPGTAYVKTLAAARCRDQAPSQQWFVRDDGVIRWTQDVSQCVRASQGVFAGRELGLDNCSPSKFANVYRDARADPNADRSSGPSRDAIGDPRRRKLADDNGRLIHLGLVLDLGKLIDLCMQAKSDKVVLAKCNDMAPAQLWSLRRFSTLLVAGQDRCAYAPDAAEMIHGTPVQARKCEAREGHQEWLMDDDGTLMAPAVTAGGCLSADADASSTVAMFSECNGGLNQKWGVRADGTLRPRSRPGSCLDLGEPEANGIGAASVNACEDGKASQQFAFSTAGVQLHWRDDRCMELPGVVDASDPASKGSPVVSWACENGKNLKWLMRSDQTVRPQFNKNVCLDVSGRYDVLRPGQPIVARPCDGSPYQKWQWMANRNIRSMARDDLHLCIEVPGQRFQQGTPLKTGKCSDQNSQRQRWTPR